MFMRERLRRREEKKGHKKYLNKKWSKLSKFDEKPSTNLRKPANFKQDKTPRDPELDKSY